MKRKKLHQTTMVAASFSALCADGAMDAFHWNARIGKGVNMGNMLEAPRERVWGVQLKEEYFDRIADAGFNSVRIPIRWSAHAKQEPPYSIDRKFFRRVDSAIDQALSRGLTTIINIHHYNEFMEQPEAHEDRVLALWKQIAERYEEYPENLYFEVMNEPHRNVTAELWNDIQSKLIKMIRKSNPDRALLVAPIGWNRIDQLEHLRLPPDDRNLIVSIHYYEPHPFTHQGASWVDSPSPTGRKWTGSKKEMALITGELDTAVKWAEENNLPLHIGEFGAYSKADMTSRARWTAFVRSETEKRGMSLNYWEFCSSFGVYDPTTEMWRPELLNALLSRCSAFRLKIALSFRSSQSLALSKAKQALRRQGNDKGDVKSALFRLFID